MLALLGVALLVPSVAEAKKLQVVTTLTDLAELTQEVGGDKVDVEAWPKVIRTLTSSNPSPASFSSCAMLTCWFWLGWNWRSAGFRH